MADMALEFAPSGGAVFSLAGLQLNLSLRHVECLFLPVTEVGTDLV